MDHPTMTDELDRRLRAARPPSAEVDEHAVDADLLARIRALPVAPRRRVPRTVAVPVAVGATAAATAVVMLAGPGDVGGPSRASALTQTLRWLNPPAGTVLHARSVETEGTRTTTREFWQSADDPAAPARADPRRRRDLRGRRRHDLRPGHEHDLRPARRTVTVSRCRARAGRQAPRRRHRAVGRRCRQGQGDRRGRREVAGATARRTPTRRRRRRRRSQPPARRRPSNPRRSLAAPAPGRVDVSGITLPAGDPIVTKVRVLLQMGHATVLGRERHNGVCDVGDRAQPGRRASRLAALGRRRQRPAGRAARSRSDAPASPPR